MCSCINHLPWYPQLRTAERKWTHWIQGNIYKSIRCNPCSHAFNEDTYNYSLWLLWFATCKGARVWILCQEPANGDFTQRGVIMIPKFSLVFLWYKEVYDVKVMRTIILPLVTSSLSQDFGHTIINRTRLHLSLPNKWFSFHNNDPNWYLPF